MSFIQYVEAFGTKIDSQALEQRERSRDGEVQVHQAWSFQNEIAGIAKTKRRRNYESLPIEPAVWSALITGKVSVADAIRTNAARGVGGVACNARSKRQ